jgi:GNAT superfamily N-acetyltransferase
MRIRDAAATESPTLEALQRRASDVRDAYREHLAANPDDCVHELDGLFVEPNEMSGGIGRALVEDAAARAAAQGATSLEVTAGPAQGFDEKVGFYLTGAAQTRFGPAVRMRRDLQP